MNELFPEITNRFGFGCMRLPLLSNGEVDLVEFQKMVDAAMKTGCNYFDTATVYLGGKSETAIKDGLASRYPRSSFVLTDKLSSSTFSKEEEIIPQIEFQLKQCGVSYFDFLLMHAQSSRNYEQYQRTHAYEKGLELKRMGKIKHLGLSFHDTPEFLDKILNDHPEVEVVQLQFNYLDYENPNVQSKGCYEVALKHHKPVIVMEPVKGGELANLPAHAAKMLNELEHPNPSQASYALRFVLSFSNIFMVLSGMSNLTQMEDNLKNCARFTQLNETEMKKVLEVGDYLRHQPLIECTSCHYCTPHCPRHIAIPELFRLLNRKRNLESMWYLSKEFSDLTSEEKSSKPSACLRCGACEKICPQKLAIRQYLQEVAREFEK